MRMLYVQGFQAPSLTVCKFDSLERNSPPEISINHDTFRLCVGALQAIAVQCSDADGDTVDIVAVGIPPWGRVVQVIIPLVINVWKSCPNLIKWQAAYATETVHLKRLSGSWNIHICMRLMSLVFSTGILKAPM